MRGRPKKIDTLNQTLQREAIAQQYADEIINNRKTIRKVAEDYNVSKSTIHTYLHKYITSPDTLNKLSEVLNTNSEIKHIHGGETTKLRYKGTKKSKK